MKRDVLVGEWESRSATLSLAWSDGRDGCDGLPGLGKEQRVLKLAKVTDVNLESVMNAKTSEKFVVTMHAVW
jgi:hypothetical protein